ncbi:gibberellin 2-beta-dioxygenase 4-like [Mizuhopecten yessoensis]|uniref:Gibberellin 2-beta-dioxygenase 4 n=1 Tax=Mizuhopecten yessoensis TaxID=6573 RepID=A0A210PH57_MIZYE|nr:gibberellin 2-beta-dioxygenase 4-like [Mizuhopecten yessoensis]OWF35819.1 Gibberellin 2-beta-dioxygenase 4 [Mizuhopecten yessoensis]
MEPGTLQLPVIDMSKSRTQRDEMSQSLIDALENVGFLAIDNIEGLDFDILLRSCKWFFNQPYDKKKCLLRKQWNPENTNMFRGYFPVIEGEPSRKEGFEFGPVYPTIDSNTTRASWIYEENVWPEEDGKLPFKSELTKAFDIMHNTAMEILRLTARGIGIDENAFIGLFDDKPLTTFRMIHYPTWESTPPEVCLLEDGKVITTPEHTDTGFMTLLTTFGYSGLEVMTADGRWAAVAPRSNSLVMNIGDVFSRMLGGRFRATRHRVVDIGEDRFSFPFFLEPSFDADIGVNFLTKFTGSGPKHVPELYGPWVFHQYKYVKKHFEYRVLPDV